jgi:signal transduction histidine kinase/CheY-like chemotaxis protein
LELAGRRKGGSEFSVEISLSYVDEGGTRMALALITDITERKRIEEQIRRSEKLESIGLLAAGIAHDFNNLLVGIIGNASLLLETASESAGSREMLESIITSGERAAYLTRQLLAFAGKERFAFRPLDPTEFLHVAVEQARRDAKDRVRVEVDIAPELPVIQADTGQLQQVILNLVRNAIESIGERRRDGLIRLIARTHTLHLGHGDLEAGTYVGFEVADNGSGMDEETLARAFDPFFTTKFLGRGMGLPAAQGIIRSHRGEILAQSERHVGSSFTVLVPAMHQPAAGLDTPSGLKQDRMVMVVDDELVVREMAKRTLERSGYAVILADNGRQAVEKFALYPDRVSLVLLDLTMPVMGGEETLDRLRELQPKLKVLLSTGYSEADALRPFRGKGLAGFVQKPYTPQRLIVAVQNALGTVPSP